jgi:hypothetical protein
MLSKIKPHYFYQLIENELNFFYEFFAKCWILPLENGEDSPLMNEKKTKLSNYEDLRDCEIIIIDGNLNYNCNIQSFLESIKPHLQRHNRISIVLYNSYFKFIYQIANFFKIRKGNIPNVFLTKLSLDNLCRLSGFELTLLRPAVYCPFYIPVLSNLINRFFPIIPIIKNVSFSHIAVIRPIKQDLENPSLSIVIPAKNERDNIQEALKRIPKFKTNDIEVIFVEGNSNDGTWDEILTQISNYKGSLKLKAFKQNGKGKKNAVEVGFEHATGEILTILDADLTMPPENLVQFYNAYVSGLGDFINGNRLFYPMENYAMKPLNLFGNIFFAKALSYVLNVDLSDSLCGTKLFSKKYYKILQKWNENFGKFDPFGDFEMIFPACILGFGVIDVPIRYKNRTYGTTNISRFKDGFQLLKMVLLGFFKTKIGKVA